MGSGTPSSQGSSKSSGGNGKTEVTTLPKEGRPISRRSSHLVSSREDNGEETRMKGNAETQGASSDGGDVRTAVSPRDVKQDNAGSKEDAVKAENGSEAKGRVRFFWGRQSHVTEQVTDTGETERVAAAASSVPSVTNEIIPHSDDAILYRSKKDTEITEERESQVLQKQNPNIVVPNFDVLPRKSAWTSLSSSLSTIAHSWHIASGERKRQACLYQRGPEESLYKLSSGGKCPIKVLIVGVHGFFPTKMIRPFIGEPTGTSMKFVSEAEEVVLKYFHKHGRSIEISKIALEREGEVLDRVNFFFDVMRNWLKEINEADFIYFVAHSQGCPVTIMLLSQLIDAGIINLDSTKFFQGEEVPLSRNKKIISIVAMAGINNGPFYGADQTLFVRAYQTIERESLRELFQFQKFDSMLSKMLMRSIRIIIGSGVKITFVGSINDQLVPLYSSICLFANHPNMFRATFIDRGSRTPAFLTRLLNIAGTLLNLGYDDHGIIKEISSSLAGTLTGGGHSTVYNEEQVYELGLRFALETTDVPADVPVEFRPFQLKNLGSNPYHLPWCMRGLLYETNAHLDPGEISHLFNEFEDWQPDTKQLKDVKYRLNGLRSRL
ncbi:hypothetical protein HG536_0A05730 [Torulaspora globosa]|uniref:YMC020W-like alpha/beta hydrolase domain-containing protein n=1 Tax=Torulaspora globosa TaxID=48254 RepID=A0A7G3ZB72_9SACH|nr:uncharacterized protein HG536_0A05730 [Torulaspora globosa]QLL30758.1 hypothetical protein HG536_0A05730 [Torulaspora globosa]